MDSFIVRTRSLLKIAAFVLTNAVFISLPSFAQTHARLEKETALQLSLNENPNGPASGVVKSIQQQLVNIARYTDKEGDTLISAIAKREGVSTDQIIPGEILELLGIYLGLKGGKGGEFVYTVPGYPALVNAAARVGGVVISVPLNDKLEDDLPALKASINSKTQAIFLVNPHNPSGTVSEKKSFHDFIHETSQQALIIVDEAYLEFSDDFQGRTAVNNVKEGDNVLVFRTFAKAYGMAGLSLGYAVANKSTAAYLKKQGLGNVHDLNRLSVAAAIASLADKNYVSGINQLTTTERSKWNNFFDGLGLKHTNSQANFVYFDTGKPYADVAGKLKEKGITIARVFAPYVTWIRITIGTPVENKIAQGVLRTILH